MNSKPFLDAICKRIVEAYRKAYGNAVEGIFLYGSYARGDYVLILWQSSTETDLIYKRNVIKYGTRSTKWIWNTIP